MSVQMINKNNFEEIKNSDKLVLLDFYADWCGPCRMVAPILHEIAEERPDVIVGKINVDEEEDLSVHSFLEPVRPLPESDQWFENVWNRFRKENQ